VVLVWCLCGACVVACGNSGGRHRDLVLVASPFFVSRFLEAFDLFGAGGCLLCRRFNARYRVGSCWAVLGLWA